MRVEKRRGNDKRKRKKQVLWFRVDIDIIVDIRLFFLEFENGTPYMMMTEYTCIILCYTFLMNSTTVAVVSVPYMPFIRKPVKSQSSPCFPFFYYFLSLSFFSFYFSHPFLSLFSLSFCSLVLKTFFFYTFCFNCHC